MNRRPLLAVLIACMAGGTPLLAERYSSLSGLILDTTGAGIPGAAIAIVNQDSGFRRITQSQPDGHYLVPGVGAGVYKLTVRKDGFRTVVRFGVKLAPGRPARVDFTLPLGSTQETITVEGTAPLLNREDATLGILIAHDEIERLPLSGRGLLTLLELAPGTVATPASRGEAGQFTVNGQRPNTHYFTVDGASANTGVSGGGVPAQATGGALPGLSAFGSLQSLISLEALEEFRVQTSSTVPEFGRLPGANVALTSRSGANQLHGSLVEHFRHDKFDSNDWFANRHGDASAALRLNDFAASLGGPIQRDRMFFFASYEGLRLRQPFAWRTAVPSLEVRDRAPAAARDVFALFPLPNGPELGRGLQEWSGRNRRPSRLDVGSLRLDRAFGSRLTAFARYNQSPSANEFGNSQVNRLDLHYASFTAGVNVRPRPDITLDTRINGSNSELSSSWFASGSDGLAACQMEAITRYFLRTAGHCDYLVRISVAGAGQVMMGREGDRRQAQFQFVQNAAFTAGTHTLRLGADYRRLRPERHDADGSLSVIADSAEDLLDIRYLWLGDSPRVSSDALIEELSLSAQDTWRVTPRLTATYGVRWEFNPAPVTSQEISFLDPETGRVTARRGPIWPVRYNNFAPRLGVAYALDRAGRTVLRAGGGIYYDSSLSIGTDLINGGPLSVSEFTSSRHAPFSMLLGYGFVSDLRLPLVKEWSVSLQRAVGERQVVSAGYAGSAGRRLIRREVGGLGSTGTSWNALATNYGASRYHSLQLQWRRPLTRGFQGTVSYTWSHSIDNSSSDALLHWAGSGFDPLQDRASSDFDARHTFSAALTGEAPRMRNRLLRNWSLDAILRARSGFPINILTNEYYTGVSLANAFRPDLVAGQPLWITDPSMPGGRRLNREAFAVPAEGGQGSLGRNAITGLGMFQMDLALRREFPFHEGRSLEVRLEAFNALNHPNFADPASYLVNPLFGQPLSMLNLMMGTGSPGTGLAPIFQIGGPRSLQAVLRFRF